MTSMGEHARSARGRLANLTAGARKYQTVLLVVLIILIAAGLAAYAAAASYDTVSKLAAEHGVSLPRLNPVGIDGGLAGIIIIDIALTWIGEPIWWLRLAVRFFAAGMIGANAAAGWPSLVGTGLRIAAPVLFVIITEAGRTMLLRRKHAAERARRAAERQRRREAADRRRKDRIPRIRWVLDFKGTKALWKRMRLWRESSYRAAVNMELERLAAIEKLAMKYGRDEWQDRAPADLVWRLTSGVRMPEALAAVAALVAADEAAHEAARQAELGQLRDALAGAETARGEAERRAAEAEANAATLARKVAASAGVKGTRKPGAKKPAASSRKDAGSPPEPGLPDDFDAQTEALRILAAEPGISGAKLGVAVGLSERWGQKFKSDLAKTAPKGPDAREPGR